MTPADEPLVRVLEVLARRGAIDVFQALEQGAVAERALTRRLSVFAASVVSQRIEDLRRIGAVETVPESGELRLSSRGRRLQGVLSQLGQWAVS